MTFLTWYGFTSVLLGILLFFPVRRFMLAINVGRYERRIEREITADEHAALKKRMNVFAALISITFAFFYNRVLLAQFLNR